ncbi:mraY protein [Lactobacillus selangorensis]|uniref:Phospho-N-acetylmuramoyl-pentapeptide-transferase n=1 Tax=Lactobacillus selangorensis TaxID=81857 RepID=A0A0R2FLF2_9LACO|nr:phospho-N-acetylmuramoyl-pentapeptide-transferase [Lactobacillus selangorensis]KRN29360.1 mraY protein [Lactobacillus selangorensis]KRN34111.1 mraY protein [Lactobacillus selangorensis]
MEIGKMLIPIVSSFAITIILLPLFIGYFRMKKEGQVIREEGPKWHEKKSGTPTMGGVVFILAIAITSFWVGAWTQTLTHNLLLTVFILLLYGVVGFLDDFIKLAKKRNEGLTPLQKLSGQLLGGIIFLWVYYADKLPHTLMIPGIGAITNKIIYSLFVLFWLIGFSNAVNLTDGIDGLVSGLGIISFATYAIIAAHEQNDGILVVCLAVIGGLIGFLLFNHKPAKIFMGDVGSLALGGTLAAISILLHREFSLLLIGLVYVIETASVMLQVSWFHMTGKRIFKMTPIHHAFEMSGWNEWQIDLSFWAFAIVCSALYLWIFL